MSFNLNVYYWVSDYTESWNRARIMHDSSLYFVMPASAKLKISQEAILNKAVLIILEK